VKGGVGLQGEMAGPGTRLEFGKARYRIVLDADF
jgi:hypothetical protein